MLLEVLLVEDGTDSKLLTWLAYWISRQVLIDFGLLVWVVELETAQLVLNTLNDDLSDLVQLVLAGIVPFLLHQLMDFVVFHAPGELALS